MKSNNILRGLPVAVFAGAFCVMSPALRAQSQNNTQQQDQQQQPTQQNSKYVGTIMKLHNGKYALVTGKTPQGALSGHFLDDQKDAQKYDGKKVDVTGSLNPSSNTIHVTNIHQE